MKQFLSLLALAAFFTFSSCGPQVYTAPAASAATSAHSLIAIVPPTVTIIGRPKDDPEALQVAAENDVYAFQHELYSWMLHRKQQGRIQGVEILDPETTNAKLKRAGFEVNNNTMTPAELADALGVDAVITSTFNTTKPMSEGAAIAVRMLLGTWSTTKRTTVNLSIHDAESGVLWNYDWSNSGSFATSEGLVNGLMRNASRKMPYVVAR